MTSREQYVSLKRPELGEFEGPDITFQSPELDLWSLLQSDHGWSKFARPSPESDLWTLL